MKSWLCTKLKGRKKNKRKPSLQKTQRKHKLFLSLWNFTCLCLHSFYNKKKWSRLIFRMKAVIFIHILYLILIKSFMVNGVTKCESKVELRAVLLSCPSKETGCDDDDPLSQVMKSEESQILQADPKNFDSLRGEKERGFPNAVKDCKRKLIITLKIRNVGKIPCDDEFIVVDHVFDPVTGGKGRLLSPVVLKLQQKQMIQLYGLQFQRVVNSDPFEEQKTGDKICSTDSENPICGMATYDGKPIPFSEGFCCSYDPHVNAKRQLPRESRRDSFLNHDSKLISQGNARPVREEKPNFIFNPKLVKLRSKKSAKISEDDKGSDCGGISDPLSWDRIPNYLLEHDRKIVCDRGDFMNELCKLQEDKIEAQVGLSDNYRNVLNKLNNNSDKITPGVKSVGLEKIKSTKLTFDMGIGNTDPLSEDQTNNIILLKNFIKALNADQTVTPETADAYGTVKGSRGKRENRKENKKLSLDERLGEFVSSKQHISNKRKRLLELSHKRFRKADEGCEKNGGECQRPGMNGYFSDDYVKSPPPKYFFSHDRFIIDPLESPEVANTSCKSSNEFNYEDEPEAGSYESVENKINNKMKEEEKFLPEIAGTKKERQGHNEVGRTENGIGKNKIKNGMFEESRKGRVSFKGDKRFNLYRDADENPEEEPEKENKEEKMTTGDEHHRNKNRFNSKNLKNLFHKNEPEKKPSKPRIRNFFMAKNRERQNLRSELVKGNKKVEFNHKEKESSENKKFQELLKQEPNDIENHQPEDKKISLSGNEKKNPMEQQESQQNQESPVSVSDKFEIYPQLYQTNKEMPKEKEIADVQKDYLQQPQEKKTPAFRFLPPNSDVGEVDFNVEIIRNKQPEISTRKHHLSSAEQFVKNRVNAPATTFETKVYDVVGDSDFLKNKQSPLLYYKTPQRYFIVESEKASPRGVYMSENDRSHFTEMNNHPLYLNGPEAPFDSPILNNRMQPNYNSYFFKQPLRRRYMSLGNEENLARSGQLFLPKHDDKLPETQLRGKRYSELLHRYEENKKIASRPQTFEAGLRLRRQRVRNKRSASYSFQPARGFFRSELDFKSPDEQIIHELKICSAEQNVKKNEPADSWASKLAGWQFSRMKRENLSIDAKIISSLQQLQGRFNYPIVTSREMVKGEKKTSLTSDKKRLLQSYMNAPKYVLEEVEAALKEKRQANSQGKQFDAREGQPNEKDIYSGEYTQDTAHCMRLGDMWYSLYLIKKPIISQTVGIQLFDRRSHSSETSQWRDLTKGRMVRVGTFLPKAEDELPTISITFMGGRAKKFQSAIDYENYYLLIPSHVSDPSKLNVYPQFDGGPGEYLLVRTKDVTSGLECNMVGTSFEAFAQQPDRCTQRKGSCLKRQPIDLWREDMEARIRGKRGKYFVENYGTVSNSSVKTYTNLTGEFLALDYYGEYTSTIEIEVKADSNAIVRKGSNAQIPLVYIDSTYPKKTRIILSVLNIGLTSSYFRPRLGDCPPDLDPAWCPLQGPLVTIPPQQRHDFKLDLSGALPNGKIHLSVQVLNQVNKKIAFRKIIIKKGDRCVCAFHCKCSCIGNLVNGRTCYKLSPEEYRKAGYIGSYPFRGGAAASASESILGNIHIIFLTASYILLFLGVMKGIIGVFIRGIGIAGTRVITGPRLLCEYYETELQGCSVLYDECGFPVHPTTCQPVQIVPLWIEIIINFLFFFLYPLRGIWSMLLSLPCCRTMGSECDLCCLHCEMDSDHKCSRPLLSKDPHHTCVHYNMTTVNSMKSKEGEFLPYPAYKIDDDPLEEDDTEFVLQEMKRYRKK